MTNLGLRLFSNILQTGTSKRQLHKAYIVSNFYLVIQYEFGTPNQYFQVRIKLFPEAWSYVSKLEKGSSMVDC
tara:strand:- start:243 stop:461 length:219 start_codon:yes stop_codon:yes gene_type:complete